MGSKHARTKLCVVGKTIDDDADVWTVFLAAFATEDEAIVSRAMVILLLHNAL